MMIRKTGLWVLMVILAAGSTALAQISTETFESGLPSSAPLTPTAYTLSSGSWTLYNSYRGTNTTYICPDGGAISLRVLKNGGYAILPQLTQGAGTLSYEEGRGARTLDIQKSTDNGTTWVTVSSPVSVKCNVINVAINDPAANRVRILDSYGSDADVDNCSLTAAPSAGGLSVAPGSAAFGNVLVNTTSAERSSVISGTSLTPTSGTVSVTAPTGSEVSLTSGSGFGSALSIPYSGGILNPTSLYMHWNATAAGAYSGTVTISGGGGADVSVVLSGTGILTPSGPVFVSPAGNDANAGTIDSPYLTLDKALSVIGTDSMIYVRGGTFSLSSQLNITQSGSTSQYLNIRAYQSEQPVFDFATETSGDGFSVKGNYLHLAGLEIKNSFHNGINVSGSNNIIERCVVHDSKNTGIQMGSSSGTLHPANNLFLNCDSHHNYDAPIGGNADGFGAKWNIGSGNVYKGCRSWNNSDDGWDLWMGDSTVTFDSCFSFRNGVDSWFSGSFNGNGNGFKVGGNNIPAPHILMHCVAFDNAGNTGRGFDENNNLAGQTLYNCTAWRNKSENYHFTNTVTTGQHIIKNCISYVGVVNITSGTISNNSWQGFTVSDADFRSMDTSLAVAPRNPDGSLPVNAFFRLATGSSMIDAGTNVGLPYNGSAPDLGAFEYNNSTVSYTLTVSAVNGAVTKFPNQSLYDSNSTVQLTAVPSTGYHFTSWSGDLSGSTNPASLLMNGNKSVTAGFAINTYQITVTQGIHGTITPGTLTLAYGTTQRFAVLPDTGYQLDTLLVDGVKTDSGTGYTFTNISAPHSLRAVFSQIHYVITASAGSNGTITPSGAVSVAWGASQLFTIAPSGGYHIDSLIVDGAAQAVSGSYTFSAVKAAHTIRVTFAADPVITYTLTTHAVHGSVTPAPALPSYTAGTVVVLTAMPSTGYHFTGWTDSLTGVNNPDSIVMNSDKVVTANYAINRYTITASVVGNGTITPSGDIIVDYGTDTAFIVTPAVGYHCDSILVNGLRTDSLGSYRFRNVITPASITAYCSVNYYQLTVNTSNGTVVRIPDLAQYPHGTVVRLTASPAPGFIFTGWSGDLTGNGNPDSVTMTAPRTVTAGFADTTSSTGSLILRSGWNLISLPVMVADPRKIVLFPDAVSQAFIYQGRYLRKDSLQAGIGYWLKMSLPDTLSVAGDPIIAETLGLAAGWNMIGGISTPLPVGAIGSLPPGLTTSALFGYAGRYAIADTVFPGRGYWIKAYQSGSIILTAAPMLFRSALQVARITGELPPAPPQAETESTAGVPHEFYLLPNYPNPANPVTTIRFGLPQSSRVTLTVYNLLGENVAQLVNGQKAAGRYEVLFDASMLSTGMYICRLNAGPESALIKMVVVR